MTDMPVDDAPKNPQRAGLVLAGYRLRVTLGRRRQTASRR